MNDGPQGPRSFTSVGQEAFHGIETSVVHNGQITRVTALGGSRHQKCTNFSDFKWLVKIMPLPRILTVGATHEDNLAVWPKLARVQTPSKAFLPSYSNTYTELRRTGEVLV